MPSYTEEDMLKAINLVQNGQSQVKAAEEASVPRSSLRDGSPGDPKSTEGVRGVEWIATLRTKDCLKHA
jgi:hypothetical protein